MITLNRPMLLAVAAAALVVLLLGIAAVLILTSTGLSADISGYLRATLGQPLLIPDLTK